MDDESVILKLLTCDPAAIERFSFVNQSFYTRVLDAHDGDSLRVSVEVNKKLYYVMTRLIGIDTAEITSKNPVEQARAVAARNFALSWALQKPVDPNITKKQIKDALAKTPAIVFVKCREADKFGRVLTEFYRTRDDAGPSLNEQLIASGHAIAYEGDKKVYDWGAGLPATPPSGTS